jgi:hypothetical protein
MKSLRLLTLALFASTCTASAVLACDTAKSAASATSVTSAKGTSSASTAAMSAQCTAAMRAACDKNAAVTASNMKDACAAHGASATSAVTAGYSKDCCTAHGASATSAVTAGDSKDAGSAQGASATTAVSAATTANGKCDTKGASMAKGASCPMHSSATTAGMDRCASAKGASLTMAAAGMVCSEHMGGVAHECSACEAWADCDQAVRALGAKTQVISLKNGAMIVYTADSNSGVKGIQSLISKRNDKMLAALSASSDKKLCDECKQLRGAMASGKLHREVVNVERGCLTLITSDDRGLVQKIRAMTGQPVAMR